MKKSAQSDHTQLLETLRIRFQGHPERHPNTDWGHVETKLETNPTKLAALAQMEATGGEPDVVGLDPASDEILFVDCAPESPTGRTALCYDRAGWESRKARHPAGNVVDTAAAMGVELLDEAGYRHLQSLGEFDCKTSSWIATPPSIRQRGGALFGDRRYGQVFIYHNGAQSYYSARGFRAALRV